MKKSNLDEMQELALLKIARNGCWFAFWGLLAAMGIQMLLGVPGKAILGEWIIFIALGVYLVAACLRHGIWDRHLKANPKTNLAVSAVAGVAMSIFFGILFRENVWELLDYLLISAIPGVAVFILCFGLLTVCSALYKKRREKLDRE